MKSPITGKEMELIREKRKFDFRKEPFEIVYHFYRCADSGEQFTDNSLDELNRKQIYNQYRVLHNIPFPEEIMAIREKYGVSAVKMSEILGFGVNGYRNYEAGEMPSVSNANLIRLADNPENFKEMVALSEMADGNAKEKLMQKMEMLIEEDKRNEFDIHLRDYLLGSHRADIFSGFRKPNLDKFTEMVVFFARQMKPYKTKMNKLLFYADFMMFRESCFSISGVRYRAINMGPVPSNFNSVFEYLTNNDDVGIQYVKINDGYGEQFIARKDRPFNNDLFTDDELQILHNVSKRFKKVSTGQIIETSHLEEAWKKNRSGNREISYDFAFELRDR